MSATNTAINSSVATRFIELRKTNNIDPAPFTLAHSTAKHVASSEKASQPLGVRAIDIDQQMIDPRFLELTLGILLVDPCSAAAGDERMPRFGLARQQQ